MATSRVNAAKFSTTQAVLVLAVLVLLSGCDSKHKRAERERTERRAARERVRAAVIERHRATDFTDLAVIYPPPLTIDLQDAIAANPARLYWSEADEINIFRNPDGAVVVSFESPGDHLVELLVPPQQLAALREYSRKQTGGCLLVFSLTSVSPLRLHLSSEVDAREGEASSSVVVADVKGKRYAGRLEECAVTK